MKIKLESVKITIGKKELILTPEDARSLHNELSNLFNCNRNHYYWPTWTTTGTNISLTTSSVNDNTGTITCTNPLPITTVFNDQNVVDTNDN
jgi:hypothetical protein